MLYHILFGLLVILWLYFLWSRRHFYKAFVQMPGPWGVPFIGLGLKLLKPEQFLPYLENISNKYKTPFISWLGTKCFLYVNDPETVQTIFNSSHCLNKGEFYDFLSHAIGDGLFTSSVPRWNKHRRLLNPSFSRSAISSLLPIFNQQANRFVENLSTNQRQSLEIYEMLKTSVLETSLLTTMGQGMDSQNNDIATLVFNAYNGITEICVTRMLRPWLYPKAIYHLSKLHQREKQLSSNLHKFVENLMQQQPSCLQPSTTPSMLFKGNHNLIGNNNVDKIDINGRSDNAQNINQMENIKGTKYNNNVDTSTKLKSKSLVFIQQMRNYIERQLLTRQDVRDEANVIVAATFETTSTALYFVCLCLAMHPKCQNKLYHELVEIFPEANDDDHSEVDMNDSRQQQQHHSINKQTHSKHSSNGQRCQLITAYITDEHLERMKYTEMVIKEAMRLFAPVPVVLRQAAASFQLNNGCTVPEGTQIAIDIYNMQRSHHVWGPLAKEFQPEAHFSDNVNISSYAFVPFTKGLRMCIGYRYALTLMKIMLVKIFRNFHLTTTMQLQQLKVKGTISLKLQKYPTFNMQGRPRVEG